MKFFSTLAVVATSVLAVRATDNSSVVIPPAGTGIVGTGTGYPLPTGGNGTNNGGSVGSPTKTPIGPTSTIVPANGASANNAGSALAVLGLAVAYFL